MCECREGFCVYKVLLVDDEALIREAISENTKWEELGYELIGTCKNGREAIAKMEQDPADLLLTDICMPYVDGIELTKYTYEHFRETKVVIISGYDDFEYAQTAVKYQVMDYILKPITATELAETLTTIKEKLDKERFQKSDIQKIKGAYIRNLPILKGRFLNSLLAGNLSAEEVRERLKDYKLNLKGSRFVTALVAGDDLEPFLQQSEEFKTDLAYFAIYNIADEIMNFYQCGITFQDGDEKTVLLFAGDENLEDTVLAVSEEIQECLKKFLKIESTISVGRVVENILEVSSSFHDSKKAMEFKFLLGGNQIIYAKDLVEKKENLIENMGRLVDNVVEAIRSGRENEVRQQVSLFIQALKNAYLTRSRSVFYIQNLILSIVNELDVGNLAEGEVIKKEKDFLNEVYTSEHLSEIEEKLKEFCLEMADSFRDEKSNYCKRQALRALEYIEKNYGDSEVSLNSVCSYLAMSTSYFSSIFKNYTGETFIEALTKKRMEKAKALLLSSSKKTYEIAEEVGYADPHYFSSTFKKFTGMTPTEYSRKERMS